MSQLEALVAIAIFFMILLVILSIVLIYSIKDQRIENQEYRLTLRVIIDNLIDIAKNSENYGDEHRQE